jgi:hypothetical protein
MLSLSAADGTRWQSEWTSNYQEFLNGGGRLPLSIELDRKVYDHMKGTPVAARLSVLFRVLRDQNPRRVIAASQFQLPGVGTCWIEPISTSLTCRSTERGPSNLLLTFAASESTCPPNDLSPSNDSDDNDSSSEREKTEESEHTRVFRQLSGISTGDPLTPLATYTFYWAGWRNERGGRLCAGTPATFSMPVEDHQYRIDVDLGKIRLGDYAESNLFTVFGGR